MHDLRCCNTATELNSCTVSFEKETELDVTDDGLWQLLEKAITSILKSLVFLSADEKKKKKSSVLTAY